MSFKDNWDNREEKKTAKVMVLLDLKRLAIICGCWLGIGILVGLNLTISGYYLWMLVGNWNPGWS
jgi:hypothetical protein